MARLRPGSTCRRRGAMRRTSSGRSMFPAGGTARRRWSGTGSISPPATKRPAASRCSRSGGPPASWSGSGRCMRKGRCGRMKNRPAPRRPFPPTMTACSSPSPTRMQCSAPPLIPTARSSGRRASAITPSTRATAPRRWSTTAAFSSSPITRIGAVSQRSIQPPARCCGRRNGHQYRTIPHPSSGSFSAAIS